MKTFFFFLKNVSGPSNLPELAQHVSKTNSLSDKIFLLFFFESSESDRFSIIYMVRIRFFGPGELIQKTFRAAQYTDHSLEFGEAGENLEWNHSTSTLHRPEINGIAARAVTRVKEGTSSFLLQSGLDEQWSAESMECSCYLR